MSKTDRKQDLFADIAAQQFGAAREPLSEPQPTVLPERRLPAGRSNPRAAFKPAAKLDTPEKLQRALARERRRMAPFLRNLAPAVASTRFVTPISACDWRMETEADRKDFARTLAGAGAWERVSLPHYGGPVGRAAAYYRTTFKVTRTMRSKGSLWVAFKGVDYKAHVFVNGAFLGSHEGFFAPFEFDFTAHACLGENVLVVKVENDAAPVCDGGSWGMTVDGDKLYAATGPGWDDPELGWHHCPPGMGIYQAVTIEARPALYLADLFVRPVPEQKKAELWVEVFNGGLQPEGVRFQVSVFGQNFKGTLFRDRVFEPPQKAGPRLNRFRFTFDVPKPRIWDLDSPWLYQVQVKLENGDTQCRQFGMRAFRMDESEKPFGRYFLNNREIRLRGANTMGFEQQDVMRGDFDQLRDDILLAKLCHMNFWRLTQRPVQTEVYEMCDKLGFLTQSDLPLFGYLPRRQFCEAVRQAEEMERLVRNHPCNVVISYINEPFPVSSGDKTHRQCDRAELERFFEAASHAVRLANPDRVIKPVDGDYDPPGPGLPDNHCYTCWYNGHGVELGKLHKGFWQRVKPDWFYGCGEFGAEGLDCVDLMRRRYPAAWLPQAGASPGLRSVVARVGSTRAECAPAPASGRPTSGRGRLQGGRSDLGTIPPQTPNEEAVWTPDRIKDAQSGRFHFMFFDTQRTLADWVAASQRHQAWATRIMTEAFRRDSRMNSIAIHLFIDAWPSGWMKTIMDCERRPKPAYFAYREALTPLMANIRTDRLTFTAGETMRFEFWVCNDTHDIPDGTRLRYQLEVDGRVVFGQQAKARVAACTSTFQGFFEFPAPAVKARAAAVLRLALTDRAGKVLHDTAVEVTIFPVMQTGREDVRVTVIGARDGKAARLARELGMTPVFSRNLTPDTRNLIFIDAPAQFAARRAEIEAAVKAGATAVFLELSAGEHELAGEKITIESCGMGARHFVSRATGHPLVEGFAPEDFRLWYDPAVDRIAPLLETCLRAEGWTPILATGNGGGTLPSPTAWSPALAAAEKPDGAGLWRICQIALAGRTATNPIAGIFARRLVEEGLNHAQRNRRLP